MPSRKGLALRRASEDRLGCHLSGVCKLGRREGWREGGREGRGGEGEGRGGEGRGGEGRGGEGREGRERRCWVCEFDGFVLEGDV